MDVRLVFVACMFGMLIGCGFAHEANIKQRVLADPALPTEIRSSIERGRIMAGMSKDQVIAAWGNPCWYCPGTRENSWGDTWEYNPFGTGRYSIGAGTYLFFDASGQLRHWSKP